MHQKTPCQVFEKQSKWRLVGIELDLQQTKDEKIIIIHDEEIDRVSNATGKVIDYTYQELLEFDFGSWFDKKYTGEKIVLFENFAKEFLAKDLTFAIELKAKNIERKTLAIINQYQTHNNIYITSFDYDILKEVRKINKDIKISWLIKEKINQDNIEKLLKIKGNQICPEASNVSKEDIKLAQKNGLHVRLWGVYTEEIMNQVYRLDIDGMTVNFPDKLNQLLEEKHEK